MGIFGLISSFFKKKEKYPYAPRVIEKVILPAFFDNRKIDDVRHIDVDETNLLDYELFNFGEKFVIYFENKISEESDSYIRENYIELKERERLKKMAIIGRRNEYQKLKLTTNQKKHLYLNY